MKKKFIILLSFLLVLLINSCNKEITQEKDFVANVNESQYYKQDLTNIKKEPRCINLESLQEDNQCKDKECTVALIIDSNVYESLLKEINQYKEDLKREFNYNVLIKEFPSSSDRKEIKDYIKNLYLNKNLKGVLLIGDIPTATFIHPKIPTDSIFLIEGAIKGDFYYLDIYDKCKYMPEKDAYDYSQYSCNPPDRIPLFWISRLTPPKKLKFEWVQLLKNYFNRNHNYRTGGYKYDQKILFYLPILNDAPEEYGKELLDFIFKKLNEYGIYKPSQVKVIDYRLNSSEEYLNELNQPYEFAFINAHGSPTFHQYGITPEKIINPGPMILEIRSCSVGRFTNDDYLVGHYLFNGNSFFTTAASTPVFSSSTPNFNYFLRLTMGETIFNSNDVLSIAANWMGDPTLRMRYIKREYKEDSPKICINSNEVDFGRIKIDSGIKSISELEKNSIKIINTGKSVLKIFVEQKLKEGYYIPTGNYIEELQPGQEKTFDFYITQLIVIDDGKEIIPEEAKKTGRFSGKYYIMSNDPKFPLIKIPFKGEITEIRLSQPREGTIRAS